MVFDVGRDGVLRRVVFPVWGCPMDAVAGEVDSLFCATNLGTQNFLSRASPT